MRKLLLFNSIVIGILVCLWANPLHSQIEQLHGDQTYSTYGLHSGNQIKTNFWNDGQLGVRRYASDQIGGEWPINSGIDYLSKIATYIGSEVRGTDGVLRHIVSESNGTRAGQVDFSAGDYDQDTGLWWCMTPLPGFHNPSPPPEFSELPQIAMSHNPWSFPDLWPDKMEDTNDPGWPGSWNGYFGKNITNADQESYYVMDDYNNREFPFYPDENDSLRRGLGLRVTVRGFQWSNVMVEDILFWLFDYYNIGTHYHDKMGFGVQAGPDIGGSGDSMDDGGEFYLKEDLGIQFDQDNLGDGGWTPVGLLGLAFLESPGNPFDGIDNDQDGENGSGPTLSEADFQPRMVNVGDPIILIDYTTHERTQSTMPADGAKIVYLEREITIMPGELTEVENNLIDDNLNGLIDENNGSTYGTGDAATTVYLFDGNKYINYFTGEGSDNLLIDERRDDGIDNDGDWNVLFDDLGLDGKAGTGDEGEGDGVATSGAGTLRPGEKNIDKTDISESDMIGLTSFIIFTDLDYYSLYNDEHCWESFIPGSFNLVGEIANTDILLGSAYFPLKPGDIERFSVGYIMGYPRADLFRNKQAAQIAYDANYNFAKAPELPTLYGYAEDGKVTLYWDDYAEESVDPLTGYDFEGYRIYRSTDPGWNDMDLITDGFGAPTSRREALAQFDLVNGIKGFSKGAANGVQFWLGDDTGLQHSWVDTNVVNGQTYYYAVTAYDRGIDSTELAPTETSRYINLSKDGTIEKDRNVIVVRPEAPVAGFVGTQVEKQWLMGSTTNGEVNVLVQDKTLIENRTYHVTFKDKLVKQSLWMNPTTESFSLIDITNPATPDTLLKNQTTFGSLITIPDFPVFNMILENTSAIGLNDSLTHWSRSNVYGLNFRGSYLTNGRIAGELRANDYRLEIGSPGINTSTELPGYEAQSVNFKVFNASQDQEIEFVFEEKDGSGGIMSAYTESNSSDKIYFLEKNDEDSLVVTWQLEMTRTGADSTFTGPQEGDVCSIILNKPFLANDVLEFKTMPAQVDVEQAKTDLDRIKVVPNPYIVANSWEPRNPYSTGRGPRELHFTHLPRKCTIRIFNIRGQLVQTIDHEGTFWDGTYVWDMLSKDKLDIAFGVYIYHVEAPGIGNKIGKFAVIK